VHRYSSVSAFLAHYQTLRRISASAQLEDDRKRLAAMERLLEVLRPEEREAVVSASEDPAIARHRERASLRLRRELMARGALDG
jgi:vacuolar-type H+-ATPase subunit E/Vma4